MKRFAVLRLDPNAAPTAHDERLAASLGTTPKFFTLATIRELKGENFDALILLDHAPIHLDSTLPLSSRGTLIDETNRLIHDFHECSNPIAVFGRAVILVAHALGPQGVSLAVAKKDVQDEIEKHKAVAVALSDDDFVTDREFKVISCPASEDSSTAQEGLRRTLKELAEMS